MIPNNMNRAELADFARNAATQVAAGKVTGLLADQIAAFSSIILADALELAAADQDQVAKRAAAIAATQRARDVENRALKHLQLLKYAMKGVDSPADQFDAVGFDPPVRSRQAVTPQTPDSLATEGFSNGVNVLRFNGRNIPNTVTYVIEAKSAGSDPYTIVGVSKAQRFRHLGVTPGIMYRYRVRAQAARGRVSDWSNETVVYRL